MTSHEWDSKFSEVLFRFKRIFDCSVALLSAVRGPEAEASSAFAVQGSENYKRRTIKRKHLIQSWTLRGHDPWYLPVMFFRFYLPVGYKWPSKNDSSLCVGSRWRSNTCFINIICWYTFKNPSEQCGCEKTANADEFHSFFHVVIIFAMMCFRCFLILQPFSQSDRLVSSLMACDSPW